MRIKVLIIAGALLAVFAVVFGIRATSSRRAAQPAEAGRDNALAPSGTERATPADAQIRNAQTSIQRSPDAPDGYNQLGAAFMQKARETGDFGFNQRAAAALERSFKLAPDNYEALKLRAKLELTNHRFAAALEIARRAVEQRPRDYEMYGIITDAQTELGNYREAIEAVDKMVSLRPYTPSYSRISYLRSLHGNTAGAIEAMRMAMQSAGDPESLAWCAVHLGDELVNAGQRAAAEHEYDRALFSLPDYHLALAAKARARLAAGDTEKAVEFYKRAQEQVPVPDTVIALGDLYTKLGRTDDAKRQYALVEFIERTGGAAATYSRQLALFYADHDIKLDEALAIARRERAARSDIFTNDALAWCLYKKGDLGEAKKEIDSAMRLGTRDARLLYHAGMIYKSLGDGQNASKYLKQALAINPAFDLLQADVAKETLRAIEA